MKRATGIALVLVFALFILGSFGEKAQAYNIEGTYSCEGTNPNGTPYRGTVTIRRSGNTYYFNWSVGTTYSGQGTLSGDQLTVNWGDQYPVIYTVQEDGALLVGTWGNGTGTETLRKIQ